VSIELTFASRSWIPLKYYFSITSVNQSHARNLLHVYHALSSVVFFRKRNVRKIGMTNSADAIREYTLCLIT